MRDRRMKTLFSLAVASFVAASCLAPAALAQTYCVTPATGCADGSYATVQLALTQAQTNAGTDTVRLGATTYSSSTGFSYNSGAGTSNPVTIAGAGRAATTLTRSTAGDVLQLLGGAHDQVGDLGVHIAGTVMNSDGILGGTAIDFVRINVNADPTVTNSEGLQTLGGGSVRDSRVTMALSGGTIGIACSCPGANDGVHDTSVTADTGLKAFYGGPVQRTSIVAHQVGIEMVSGSLDTVSIRMTGSGGGRFAINASNSMDSSANISIHHATLIADQPTGAQGLILYATPMFSNSTQAVDFESGIVRGFATSFNRVGSTSGANTANASLTVRYSDYDHSTVTQSGPGTVLNTSEPTSIDADPLFVDAASGDLRIHGGSPAVDTGDPVAALFTDSPTDVAGLPRVVDGNGDGVVRRDMGAFEYQHLAPAITAATATPTTALAGTPIAYAAVVTDPNADAVALSWSFDDATTATGPNPSHTFAATGNHVATVTATNSGGAIATAQVAVTVTPAPPPPPPPPPPTAVIGSLKVSPSAFRAAKSGASAAAKTKTKAQATGTTVTLKLNVAARTTFTVQRAASGRTVNGRCVTATKHNAKAKKCTRYVAVKGSFTRNATAGSNHFHFSGRMSATALSHASYRMTAAVGSGATKSTRTARFTVKKVVKHKK